MFAIRKFPRPGYSKDVRILLLGNQAQGLIGSKTGISHYHDLLHPGWRDKVLQHLPKQDILMPADLGIDQPQRNGHTSVLPTRHEQDHLKPKGIWIMRTMARGMPQGMFPASPMARPCAA